QHAAGYCTVRPLCSPRPRKRGNAPWVATPSASQARQRSTKKNRLLALFREQTGKVQLSSYKTYLRLEIDISQTPKPWVAAQRVLEGLCNFRSNISTSGNPVPNKLQVFPPSKEAQTP